MQLKHRQVANCGTYGGYQTHTRLGQDPCTPCRQAHNTYMREYRRNKGLTKTTLMPINLECPNCGHHLTQATA